MTIFATQKLRYTCQNIKFVHILGKIQTHGKLLKCMFMIRVYIWWWANRASKFWWST